VERNIFPNRNQAVEDLLESNQPARILIAPIDFAKKEHVAQICQGTGRFVFRRPMTLKNTVAGADYLLKRIEGCCRKYRIPDTNVILAGEDPPEYVCGFVHRLQNAGLLFVRVSAKEAKKYRTNTRATSDKLVLNGIAQAVVCRRAYSHDPPDELYSVMKLAERSRRRLVRAETAAKNRIHRCADVLCPGFLDEKKSGVQPFCLASCELMSRDFSAGKLNRMRTDTLTRLLKKNRTQNPGDAAAKLKSLAKDALAAPAAVTPYYSRSLSTKVQLLRSTRHALAAEENELARCLIQTPGFYLTSIPGIGVVLASGLVSEYGPAGDWPPADNMSSYGGIVPRQRQSGGSDSEPVVGHLPIDCNHHLKDWLIQAAQHVGCTEHPAWGRVGLPGTHPLREHYLRVQQNDGHYMISTAKRLLRIGRAMVRDCRIYFPTDSVTGAHPDAMSVDQYLEYHQIMKETIQAKWKGYDLRGIPDDRDHMKRWVKETDRYIEFVMKHRT